jgi:hypothetical protein
MGLRTAPLEGLQWAARAYLPDVEALLGRAAAGTPFLRGGAPDYWLGAAVAAAFPLARLLLDRTLFEWVGRAALGLPRAGAAPRRGAKRPTADDLDRLAKFRESLFKLCVQVLLSAALVAVAAPQAWFTDTRLFWGNCTALPCTSAWTSLGERFIYVLEGGFYLQGIFMVFLWETKRKDRWELFAHHVATVILIAYSYYLNLTRAGVMVLVCHEANDIFLEAAKLARYARAPEWATTGAFVAFMLSWFATRIYAFGFVVLHSTLFEGAEHAGRTGIEIRPHWTILNVFLGFLLVLHVYWSYLILRIAARQLAGSGLDDIREDGAGGGAARARRGKRA